jgi:putative spermidine/putrescine transport system substrate-binding protein
VKAFPGRRGLRNRITATLEIALMGDGVAPKDVYPCDIERAFKALDRIKPAVSHWIAQTAQTVSLIQANENDFTYTYTTRVKNMQAAGVPMDFSFQQNIMGVGWAGVVKGSPRKEAAMRLCSYIASPTYRSSSRTYRAMRRAIRKRWPGSIRRRANDARRRRPKQPVRDPTW